MTMNYDVSYDVWWMSMNYDVNYEWVMMYELWWWRKKDKKLRFKEWSK